MAGFNEHHNEEQDRIVPNCKNCKKPLQTRYRCTKCDDVYLCCACHNKEGLIHKMEKVGFGLGDPATSEQRRANVNLIIQRCISDLVHTCMCKETNCRRPGCQRMRIVVEHAKSCKRDQTPDCPICKQLIVVCVYHAKHCQEAECPVPSCSLMKTKVKNLELKQRLQSAKRVLKTQKSETKIRSVNGAALQTSPRNASSSSEQSSRAQLHPSPHPSEPGIGTIGTIPLAAPAEALQDVQRMQASAARQPGSCKLCAFVYCRNGNPFLYPPRIINALIPTRPVSPQIRNRVRQAILAAAYRTHDEVNYPFQRRRQNSQLQPPPQMDMRQPTDAMEVPRNISQSGNSALGLPQQTMPNSDPTPGGTEGPTPGGTEGPVLQ